MQADAHSRGHKVGVHLILIADSRVLMGLRENTGFADGSWSVPGGRLERGESIQAAVIREAEEELGIRVDPAHLTFVHLCHYLDPDGQARLGVFFIATAWDGEPVNAEPLKCSTAAWHPLDDLPPKTVDYVRSAIDDYLASRSMSLHGWDGTL